jgi:serine/threonine protein kinase
VDFLGAITKQRRIMIVTELMAGGSLLDIMSEPVMFAPYRAAMMATDIARALHYLHHRSPKVSHGSHGFVNRLRYAHQIEFFL